MAKVFSCFPFLFLSWIKPLDEKPKRNIRKQTISKKKNTNILTEREMIRMKTHNDNSSELKLMIIIFR